MVSDVGVEGAVGGISGAGEQAASREINKISVNSVLFILFGLDGGGLSYLALLFAELIVNFPSIWFIIEK